MSTASHPACVIPTRQPPCVRWRLDMAAAWQAWRAQRAAQAGWRALEGLSDSTLRDIGLAERLPYRPPTLGTHDLERGRW